MLRQLLYVSRAVQPLDQAGLDRLYEQSRHNNAIDGVSGLLLSDGRRFVQVIEGTDQAITATFERIGADPRHDHVAVLHDVAVAERQFGQWSMADRRRGERADEFDARLHMLLRRATPEVCDAFIDLLQPA